MKEAGPDLARRLYGEEHALAEVLRPRSIVEIGVRAGSGAAAFLAAAPEAKYPGLDADNGRHGALAGAPGAAEPILKSEFPAAAVVGLRCDTQGLESLPSAGADLAHVDGDHSGDGCLHDLRRAARSRPRWILVDDATFVDDVRRATEAFLLATCFRSVVPPTVRGDLLIRVS